MDIRKTRIQYKLWVHWTVSNGNERNRTESNGLEWNRTETNGLEWNRKLPMSWPFCCHFLWCLISWVEYIVKLLTFLCHVMGLSIIWIIKCHKIQTICIGKHTVKIKVKRFGRDRDSTWTNIYFFNIISIMSQPSWSSKLKKVYKLN